MAAAVAKLEKPAEPAVPDLSKPVAMRWWKAPSLLGSQTTDTVVLGQDVVTGNGAQGKVQSILRYPSGGVLVELRHESLGKTHYLVIDGGHGVAE